MSTSNEEIDALLATITAAAHAAAAEYANTGAPVPALSAPAAHPLDASGGVALKRAVRLLEGACAQLCATLAPPAHTIVNHGQDFAWACLRVVADARVADALAPHENGLHVRELAPLVGIAQGKLARVLRLLGTRHIFREVAPDVFANNRLSAALCTPGTLREFVQMLTYEGPKAATVLYENLTDPESAESYDPRKSPYMYAVRDEGVEGSFFDWQKLHPERRELFGRSMVSMNSVIGSLDVLQHFAWDKVSTVCDVGSGIGSFAMPLARAFPNITVTLQDLPGTIEHAKKVWDADYPEAVGAHRTVFVPLDFMKETPVHGQDIYYLRNIVHNWPDADAVKILRSVRRAMAPHSRALIHEYIIQHLSPRAPGEEPMRGVEEAPAPLLPNFGVGGARAHNQDLTMLLIFNARERTLAEMVALAAEAGLEFDEVVGLAETSLAVFKLPASE